MPLTVLGLTLARSVTRLLLVKLWSRRNEYRLVPSKTGKFPVCDCRLRKLPGSPLQSVLFVTNVQEEGNWVNGLVPLDGTGIALPASRPNHFG